LSAEGLSKAEGENSNPLFKQQQIARPMISEKAPLKGVELQSSHLYDCTTEPGQVLVILGK
ncbi:MAG: hypothetical protein IJZ40_04090, partial [Bacteroidaceae bacterium]|nr:hypothetical protein [Bacteroidaceae bacterium]